MPPSPIPSAVDSGNVFKFTKVLPLSIRREGHEGESQKESIRFTLSYPSSTLSNHAHKEIALRLTNDDNPMFFYHLRVTEAEFPELKADQGLLVDFHGFPNQLMTLLEKCDASGEEGPKFVLVMKIGRNGTVLDIVESNPFKYLCHLSLHINAGTDAEVRKYLADVTSVVKKEYSLLMEKYQCLMTSADAEGARMRELMEFKNEEISSLKDQLHAQANSLSSKHYQEMSMEKEKLLKLQSELVAKFEMERNEMERKHKQQLTGMEERLSLMETENRDLHQGKYKNETMLQDAANKIKRLEDDLKLLQQELNMLKKQNEKLDNDYHEKQRLSVNLHTRVTSLEAELREKTAILQKNHDHIMQLSEMKKNLEDHTTAMVNECERIKSINKTVSAEVIKGNEIIKKLQDDIRTLNSKSKLQTQVTTEQERVINDRENRIADLEKQLESLGSSLGSTNEELEKLRSSLEESEGKVVELEKVIQQNESMISWLNKQLNEFQGLNNLTKFRQNLAISANQLSQSQPQVLLNNSAPSSSSLPKESTPNPPPSNMIGTLAYARAYETRRPPLSGNSVNTLPNGTPSWMHIYQSTSTPLDDDLCSRLEKVSTNPTPGMSYNELKARFSDPYEITGGDNKKEDQPPAELKGKRAPTWARGRGGRVTLDMGGVPAKGNLRR